MQGHHPPLDRHFGAQTYALLIDVAGADESTQDPATPGLILPETSTHDATALTVVHVDLSTLSDPLLYAPTYRVVQRYLWTGVAHSTLYGQIKALVELWKPVSIIIDATGVGAGLASFLSRAYPHQVIPVSFSSRSKSDLGWRFLALVETGCYKEYATPRSNPLQLPPWLVEPSHLQSFLAHLRCNGRKPSTLNLHIHNLKSFYHHCLSHQVDPHCPPNFNPAQGLTPIQLPAYHAACFLTRPEVVRFLTVLRSDQSPLTLRDYALALTRLILGIPSRFLLALTWGDLHIAPAQVTYSYQQRGRQNQRRYPALAWQAVIAYLKASARLPHMQPDHYLFVPLANSTTLGVTGHHTDWLPHRSLDPKIANHNFDRFARLAGIHDKKVTLTCLKHTAFKLFADSAPTLSQLKEFSGIQRNPEVRRMLKWMDAYLHYNLTALLTENTPLPPPGTASAAQQSPPSTSNHSPLLRSPSSHISRQPYRFEPGHLITHGFTRRTPLPPHLISSVIAKGDQRPLI
jgi:site-specific recombinase XerD